MVVEVGTGRAKLLCDAAKVEAAIPVSDQQFLGKPLDLIAHRVFHPRTPSLS